MTHKITLWINNSIGFRAVIGHEGPLKVTDSNWKGSKNNVQIEWDTEAITFEPLSVMADADPIICAAYAKEKNLYHLDGWKAHHQEGTEVKWSHNTIQNLIGEAFPRNTKLDIPYIEIT